MLCMFLEMLFQQNVLENIDICCILFASLDRFALV